MKQNPATYMQSHEFVGFLDGQNQVMLNMMNNTPIFKGAGAGQNLKGSDNDRTLQGGATKFGGGMI